MFTSDALQQMAADHRSRMMAQASDARTIHPAGATHASRARRRRHVPSWRLAARHPATLVTRHS